MDDWVSHILEILGRILACFHVPLGRFLQTERVLAAAAYPFSTQLKTFVHLAKRPLIGRVEAVHGATRRFEVHDVKFFIKEGVETYLSIAHAFVEMHEHLLVHVVDGVPFVILV